MSSGIPVSRQKISRIGLSLWLCFSASSLCASKPEVVESVSDVPTELFPLALKARGGPLTEECRLAIRRSLEVAPEVLAMASWPLDDNVPAECREEGVSVFAVDLPDFPAPLSLDIAPVELALGGHVLDQEQLGHSVETLAAPAIKPNPLGSRVVALADTALDDIRGGFELADSNLKFSFGIERAVFINGQLIASTVLNVKDLQLAAGGGTPQVSVTSGVPGAVNVVQNGSGNTFATQIGGNLAGTVVQNSLDNQKIQNVTTINATVNASQILRGMSVQSAVQNGIVNSLRR